MHVHKNLSAKLINRSKHRNANSSHMVSMTQAFKLFWQNYSNFSGRSTRAEYWWWYLWNLIILMPFIVVGLFYFKSYVQTYNGMPLALTIGLYLIYGLITVVPNLAILARRLRDVGLSNHMITLLIIGNYGSSVIPFVGIFIQLIFAIVVFIYTLMPSIYNTNK